MNKALKIGGIVVGVIVVLVIALTILAKVLITPERVRSTVLPIAQDALGREVALGAIEVSLFSGISLKDLAVKEKAGDENFVSAGTVVLRYQFWPLLFMQVVVDEVRLEQPKIRVVRLADGAFNFDDLLQGKGEVKDASAPRAQASAAEGAPINLTVSKVSLSGGELLFIDQKINPQAPYRYQLTDLNVTATDLALDKSFPFEVGGRLNGAVLALDGDAHITEQRGNARVKLSDLDVTAFAPYFRDQVPGKLGSLKIDLDLTAAGGAQQVSSQGNITLRQLDLVLDALKAAPLQNFDIKLDYDVTVDLAAAVIKLAKARTDLNGIVVEATGRVENYATKPLLDLQIKVPELELRKALNAVPPALVKDLGGLDPAGSVAVEAALAGSLDDPAKLVKSAQVRLAEMAASAGGLRPALSGQLDLSGDKFASQNLVVKIGDNQANVDLQASNLFGKPVVVKSQVSADRFNLDPILAATGASGDQGVPASGSPAGKPAPSPAQEIGPFDIPVKADGTVRIGEALYHGMAIKDFDMVYHLARNVLVIEKMTGQMAGGTFSKTARIDLGKKGLTYDAQVGLKSINADPFIQAFVPKAGGTVFGDLSLDLDISGQGTVWDTLRKNLNGQGDITLKNGKITGAGLVQGLAGYLNLDELKVLSVSQAVGNFLIEQGQVKLNSTFTGESLKAKPQGTIGLGGALDLSLNALLSPALTKKLDSKGKLTGFLTDQEGWAQLPLKVAGTMTSPQFALDTSGVRKQVEQKAKGEIQKKILEKIAPGDQAEGAQKPEKKLLEDAVKGIFGR